MSPQNFDSTTMNIETVYFDLEELENIQLTVSPVNTANHQNLSCNPVRKEGLSQQIFMPRVFAWHTVLLNKQPIGRGKFLDENLTVRVDLDDIVEFSDMKHATTIDDVFGEIQKTPVVQKKHDDTVIIDRSLPLLNVSEQVTKSSVNIEKTSYIEKVSYQNKDYQTAVVEAEEQPTLLQRLFHGLLIGGIFAIIGLLIDGILHIGRVITADVVAEMSWFFLPCCAVLGVVLGCLFGVKSLEVIFATSNTIHLDYQQGDDDSSGLFKAVGIGLGIAVLCWLVMLILL